MTVMDDMEATNLAEQIQMLTVLSRASGTAIATQFRSVGCQSGDQSTTLIWTEISQQLSDGLR